MSVADGDQVREILRGRGWNAVADAPSAPARRNSPAIAPSPRPPGAPPPDLVGTL